MSDEDSNVPPPLESDDDEQVEQGQFSAGATLASTPANAGQPTATPSNTPVISLFPKMPQQQGQKRAFEADVKAAPSDADKVKEMLSKLEVGKNEDDDEDEDEDEDDEDEDEDEEEEQYVATKEQMEAASPMLRENQLAISNLKVEYQKARRELEIKFEALRNVIYEQRAKIIRGDENDNSSLPGFWLDAFQRNSLLAQFVEEWDEPALVFLDNITCSELTENFGYKLTFHFAKNPFFSNETLTKTLKLANMYVAEYSMPDIDESEGCEIKWFPEKNLTVKIEIKTLKARGGPKKGGKKAANKEIRQEVPQDSFFTFFDTRIEKTPEELEQMNEDEQEAYQRQWEMDYAIASTIRSKIVPDAALWYLGEADDSDYEDDEDEDEEGQFDQLDEDDDEDEDDDDDDDEDDEKPVKGKKGGKGKPMAAQGSGGDKTGEQQPECKQQ